MLQNQIGIMSEEINRLFGSTLMNLNNPYFVALNTGMLTILEENKDKLITFDSALNQEKQNRQIEELIKKQVNAIFLVPVDWQSVKPALEACKAANMPVFNVDTEVYNQELVVCIISSDNYEIGVKCADDMIKRRDSGKIVILDYPPGKSTTDRVQGFKDTIAGKPGYKIVAQESGGNNFEQAKLVMQQIMEEQKEIDIVMSINDLTALGALTALEEVGREENTLIYGVDGSPDAKIMVLEGKMTATVAQFPIEMGMTAAETCYTYLEGKKIERRIIIPTVLITEENIHDYGVIGWQ